jgi:hypothetical protein
MTNQASIPEPKELSMDEIKAAHPGEWVLIGNPVYDENGVHVVSGILIDHSWDKRELAYRWRGNLAAYDKHTFKFIREPGPVRKHNRFIPLVTRRISYIQ